jgi:hypothetical protein
MNDAIDDSCGMTPAERRSHRRYNYELAAGMALYCGLLWVSLSLLRHTHIDGAAKIAAALLPAIGLLVVGAAIVRFVLRTDELQRQIMIEAAAIAGLATVGICVTLGFLENAGVPHLNMMWVFSFTVFIWGMSLPFLRRAYR